MSKSNVVIQYEDGAVLEGTVKDFLPQEPVFHLTLAGNQGKVQEVAMDDLKAIFFGNDGSDSASYREIKDFDDHYSPHENTRIVFKDGETMRGYARAINLDHRGFFFTPSDMQGNQEHVFVAFSSLRDLEVNGLRVYFTSWKEG